MGTANFYSHENGIFVMREDTYEEAEKFLKEEYEEDEVAEEMVYWLLNDRLHTDCEEFFPSFGEWLNTLGYQTEETKKETLVVYNRAGKIAAELSLRSGYHKGVQVIVETDFNELEEYLEYGDNGYLRSSYTPHHKKIINELAKWTDRLMVSARFSNGETWYQVA